MTPVKDYPHIYTDSDKYYWVNETGELSEPYDTVEEANEVLLNYVEYLQSE